MKLSREKARRVLCASHGLEDLKRGDDLVIDIFEDIPCIQVDPINSAGRNHDLTLFSRIRDYQPEDLNSLLYEDNLLFEYYCKMLSILPMEYYPVFKRMMEKTSERYDSYFEEHEDEIDLIYSSLEEGPRSSLEIKDMGKEEGAWGITARVSNKILNRLWRSGKVMIHHRKERRKYYTLPEKVVPAELLDDDGFSEEEYKKKVAEIIVRSSKLVSPSKASAQWNNVGGIRETRRILRELEDEGKIFSLSVEGWNGDLYAHEGERDIYEEIPGLEGSYVRFLAPLDPLLWNRKLFGSIFGHEYVWEVYKKKEERKYGHYCLPILFDDIYVGLIEPYQDGDVLEVRSFHLFNEVKKKDFLPEFKKELKRYMNFLGAEELQKEVEHDLLSDLQM